MMEYLLDPKNVQGVSVNQVDNGGDTPLHLASYNGHLPVLRLLLKAGSDPELANKGGYTPSQLAEARRMWHITAYLDEFKRGDEEKEGEVPLELADLVRACNLIRAKEIREERELNPPPKPKNKDP